MAEWKAQINFNYAPSFHSYSYSFLCQGTDQNQVNNMSSWMEPEMADLCDDFSPSADDFPPAAVEPINPEVELSSPQSHAHSPEPHAQLYNSDFDPYQILYLDETETEGLIMPGQARGNDGRRAGSESASDSEPQTSPDSWSSGSGGDGVLPQADPMLWALKTSLDDATMSTSPDSTESNSFAKDAAQSYIILGNESVNNAIPSEEPAATAPKAQSTKGKVRAAFSEAQMNVLTQRFNVQRYLTPAEMKNMAEDTGLTYKQVKTWFQNRRMKLRRHQKDNSWASERYTLNKDIAALPNLPSHMQPYQGQARPPLKDPCSPHMFEAALKTAAPQNLALYLAAVGGPNGVAGYPIWPTNAAHSSVHARPPVPPGWPLPPDAPQYGFNARFNAQSFSRVPDAGFKEGEQVIRGAHSAVVVQNAAQ